MLSSDVKCAKNTTKLLLCLIDMLRLAINVSFILFAGILAIYLYNYLLTKMSCHEKKNQIIISKGASLAQVFLPSLDSANRNVV